MIGKTTGSCRFLDTYRVRLVLDDGEHWIYLHPGGRGPKADGSGDKKGTPALIDENGVVRRGMGGKFNGLTIPQACQRSGSKQDGGRSNASAQKTFPRQNADLTNFKPGKPPKQYLKEAGWKVRRAIVDFYDNELRGGFVPIEAQANGKMMTVKAVFDGHGRNEFQKFSGELNLILDALPHVVDVLATGEYFGRHPEPNHAPFVAFHTFVKKVFIKGRPVKVAVDVGETAASSFPVYNVNREGVKSFETKMKYLDRRRKGLTGDSAEAKFSVFSIRILG